MWKASEKEIKEAQEDLSDYLNKYTKENNSMSMRERLRENVDNKHLPKQTKYIVKLINKLERLSKRGNYSYEIIPYYMPKWFTNEYIDALINILERKGFEVDIKVRKHELGTFYNVIIIKW